MTQRYVVFLAALLNLPCPALASITANNWDTGNVYIIRTHMYSAGSPVVPSNAIQVVTESHICPDPNHETLVRFGNVLVYNDSTPKTLTFSNSPNPGIHSPRGARMFIAQGWPEAQRKTDIIVQEYDSTARFLRQTLLGATFGTGAGRLVENQANNSVSVGSIRYNPRKNTLAVGATLATSGGSVLSGRVFEFALPDWPASVDGVNVPLTPVTAVQVYAPPSGYTMDTRDPINIDFDNNGYLYLTAATLNVNGIGPNYKSDVIRVDTTGRTGGTSIYSVPISGANAGNLLIEGSLEILDLPDSEEYDYLWTLAYRAATNTLLVFPYTPGDTADPTLEYSLTNRSPNGNVAFLKNWYVDPSGLGINSEPASAQRDDESGAVFVGCQRGDPGGGPKAIKADGSIDVIGWRNWDSASPPYALVSPPSADTDGDNDVDQADFGFFQACLSGQGNQYPFHLDCGKVDFDIDQDVDVVDCGVFLNCLGGPDRPPNC